jgi:hypothetical protein
VDVVALVVPVVVSLCVVVNVIVNELADVVVDVHVVWVSRGVSAVHHSSSILWLKAQ